MKMTIHHPPTEIQYQQYLSGYWPDFDKTIWTKFFGGLLFFYHKFFLENFLQTKVFLSQNLFYPKYFVFKISWTCFPPIFYDQTFFGPYSFLPKSFGPKNFRAKNFWSPNFFWPHIFWVQKILAYNFCYFYFFGTLLFLTLNFFALQFFDQTFFGLKISLNPKFWTQIFRSWCDLHKRVCLYGWPAGWLSVCLDWNQNCDWLSNDQ